MSKLKDIDFLVCQTDIESQLTVGKFLIFSES